MVEQKANILDSVQNADSSHLQAIPERKARRSSKPPAVKAAVLIKRSQGVTKSQIARDLEITRPTVNAIIEESDLDRQLSSGVLLCSTLIPKAIGVVDQRLEKGSEAAAFRLLEGIGVLGNQAKASKSNMLADMHLQVAIQNLIQPASTIPDSALHNNAAQASTNQLSETVQVQENQQHE